MVFIRVWDLDFFGKSSLWQAMAIQMELAQCVLLWIVFSPCVLFRNLPYITLPCQTPHAFWLEMKKGLFKKTFKHCGVDW